VGENILDLQTAKTGFSPLRGSYWGRVRDDTLALVVCQRVSQLKTHSLKYVGLGSHSPTSSAAWPGRRWRRSSVATTPPKQMAAAAGSHLF